jgi:hypothetical protein
VTRTYGNAVDCRCRASYKRMAAKLREIKAQLQRRMHESLAVALKWTQYVVSRHKPNVSGVIGVELPRSPFDTANCPSSASSAQSRKTLRDLSFATQ